MAAAAVATAAAAASRAEDLRQLQQQVDSVRVQLALLGPLPQQVQTAQEYFERVECEASVQLRRLKRARVAGEELRSSSEGELSGAQQEIARWLHAITDAVIGMAPKVAAQALSSTVSVE